MKYYKIDIKSHFPELGRIASSAEGKNIANADEYFWAMNRGEILYNTPIFDYFILKSFDKEKHWECIGGKTKCLKRIVNKKARKSL